MPFFTQTLIEEIKTAGRSVRKELAITGDGQLPSRRVTVPDSSTDLLVNMAIDVSQLQLLYIVSDQDVTLETNDGTTPTDTINLLANKPYIWKVGSYFANLLTADVTAFYFTNSSGAVATVDVEGVEDATPPYGGGVRGCGGESPDTPSPRHPVTPSPPHPWTMP